MFALTLSINLFISLLFQSLKLIDLLVDGNKLLVAEQASLLFYELSVYEADIVFALPDVFVELKVRRGLL